MKTLIFYGSARKNGHTKKMVSALCEELRGEIEMIDTYRLTNVSPCKDCRYCWKIKDCAIKDGMQEIYQKIEEADNIVLAAPMYFHCIPGPMKTVMDRLQVYWAGHGPRNDAPKQNIRKGAVLMVGGAPEFDQQFQAGYIVLNGILGDLNAENLGCVTMGNTDKESLEKHPELLEKIKQIAKKFNEKNGEYDDEDER